MKYTAAILISIAVLTGCSIDTPPPEVQSFPAEQSYADYTLGPVWTQLSYTEQSEMCSLWYNNPVYVYSELVSVAPQLTKGDTANFFAKVCYDNYAS